MLVLFEDHIGVIFGRIVIEQSFHEILKNGFSLPKQLFEDADLDLYFRLLISEIIYYLTHCHYAVN